MKILHTALRALPVSQQVIRIMDSGGLFFLEPKELSLEALRTLVQIKTGHQASSWKPRLGTFSKEDIVTEEVKSGNRLRYIPFTGINAKITMNGIKFTHSEFSAHDQTHLDIMNSFAPTLIDSLREIMLVVRETTRELISDEIWEIGDFAFIGDLFSGPAQIAFNGVLEHVARRCPQSDLFHWIIILHMRTHKERWKTQYDLSVNQVQYYTLRYKNDLVEQAEAYLQNRPMLEKIYLLQELQKSGKPPREFFPEKFLEPIPQLVIKRVDGKGEGGILKLEVIPEVPHT